MFDADGQRDADRDGDRDRDGDAQSWRQRQRRRRRRVGRFDQSLECRSACRPADQRANRRGGRLGGDAGTRMCGHACRRPPFPTRLRFKGPRASGVGSGSKCRGPLLISSESPFVVSCRQRRSSHLTRHSLLPSFASTPELSRWLSPPPLGPNPPRPGPQPPPLLLPVLVPSRAPPL